MWNLSLLSRGCGDLVTREHERLDVYFEAQDYFNWRSRRNSVCVSLMLHDSEGFLHDHHNPAPPKTYSTRRGALVLYSEELALQSWQRQHGVKWKRMARLRLSTLRDLARAVLAYGRREDSSGPKQVEPYLHFLIGSRNHPGNRKIRPGYSAKRYLACLTETCNPALLHRLRGSGCISDPNLLRGTSLNSFLQQQAKYDLSEVPRPYLVLPCLPFADLYRTWPCLEEEDDEEETALDPGESCSSTAAEDRGMQSDKNRCGGSERWMKRESGEEFEDLRESSLDAVMSIPPSDLQQIKEEAQHVRGTLQGLGRPPPNPLSGGQPDKGRGHGQKSSMLGQPTIDSSQLCSRKSRMTYYGGPLAGARRGLSVTCPPNPVKSRTNGQCGSRQHMEPPNSTTGQLQLPPIHSEIGAGLRPVEEDGSGELEMLKLPRTRRRSVAAARHAGRRRGGANPEAAQLKQRLVLPPLMDISHPREKGEDIQDEGTENKGKSEAPDSTETSRMEGLDQADQIIGDYTISRERSSGLNGGNAGILPEISSHMEMEGKIVGFIGIRVEEDESLLEENKGKSEAPDSTETSRMEGLDQADRINEEQISRERSSGLDRGNVGIFPEISSHMGMEGKMVGFMGIRMEEDGTLLEENKGKSEAPDSTETSRMEGLDQADRINDDYTISRERSSGLNGGNIGILPEISSHMEMERKIIGFMGIRVEEDESLLEGNKGKSEAPDSTETSRMEGLDQADRINEEQISRERSSGLERGIVGIFPEISSHMGMEGKTVGFMGIRMEEDGTLLEENKGKSEAPDSTETSRMEGLDQADRINEERISRERSSGLDRGNVGIFPEISSHMGMVGKTVGFMGIRMEEDGTLLEEVGDQSVKPGPVLQLLPPIQETRGPGKHRNKASFRRKARRNKTSSPGIVRGTVPKKLKEVHKDISVGSLLMAPDGEIVRLSLLGPIRGPNGSFMARFPRWEGHLPLECGFSDEKVGLVTEQGLEAGDIVYGSDGELCQSPVSTHMNSEQRHTRKAFRQSGRRRTDPDGNSTGNRTILNWRAVWRVSCGSVALEVEEVLVPRVGKEGEEKEYPVCYLASPGRPEDGTARGAKVSSDRRTKGNHQCPVDPGYLEEMMLDEDGNLRQPYQSHRGSVYDSVHEGKAAQDMKRAAQGSNHGKSAVISSLSGWPQTEPSSLSTAEELGTLCSLHAVDDGCSPNPSRRGNLLVKEGLVDTGDSGTDAEDQEAELWNQLSEGSTGIKTKKQKSKRKKGQKNPNQDPNTQGNDSVPSSFEVPRNSQGPNQASDPNKPSGPRNSQGPNQASGPNKPSGPRNSQGPNQASGPNKPSGPRNSQGPNQASGLNNERNKNNKRAEFIVGRPRETIGRQRHLPPVKQKTTSKLGKKEAMRGGGDEEEREEDAQPSSEAGGALHSPRRRNTPTSVSAVKDPNSPFTDTTTKGPATDQGRRRERAGESPDRPLGTSPVPGSKHLIQSGSSRLEGRQRPNGEQQDRSEQRRLELEKQIQQELDDDQRRKEEEIRNKKQQHEHEAIQQQEAEQSRRHREQQEREWDQRQREEYRRKVQEIQHRKERSLAERAEETERLQREWQKQLEEEEQLLKGMDEPQRLEYLRLKQIKEQQEKEYQEERRRKEGERSKCLMEGAMQEAVFLLRQKGLMERDLMFHRNLLVEVIGLEQSQSITRPWVFSYFELIEFLGQETPVEEIMKESSHSGQWD